MMRPAEPEPASVYQAAAYALIATLLGVAIACTTSALMATRAHAEIITVQSAAGPVKVSDRFAPHILPVIATLVARGFDGEVKCWAPVGSRPLTPNSSHYTGAACDFLPKRHARRGRNRMPTLPIMFTRATARLIREAGLRNGCIFRDCGHIDMGGNGHRRTRMARR